MFGKKKPKLPKYDTEAQTPVLKKSICTGETTAGFKDRASGKFYAVMLIKSPRDLNEFMEEYGIADVPKTEY